MRRFILILTLFASVSLHAEDFKILFVNSESIKIGKTVRKAGDTFSDTEKIYWKDGKQAMKVISLESKKQYVLVSEDFKKKKLKTAKEFIFKNHRLSTRGIGRLSDVGEQVGHLIYWFDPTLISFDYDLDEGDYFFLRFDDNDIPIEIEENQLVLDSRIWEGAEPQQIEVDLFFHYNTGDEELVSPRIMIVPLPEEIVLRKR